MTTLMVATTGGHLAQLFDMAPQLSNADRVWVTHENDQSRSLLAGEDVAFVPYICAKDVSGVMRNIPIAHRLARKLRVTRIISTGSGIALSYLPYFAARGVDAHYIESATRVQGPSLTGQILSRVPGVRCYPQYERNVSRRWGYAGSVFDRFRSVAQADRSPILRAVVTVGTAREFTFRPMLDAIAPLLRAGGEIEQKQGVAVETLWQTGCTPTDGLGIDATPYLAAPDLDAALESADLVVSHAGAGSALSALRAGRMPVLVPRDASAGEAGDNHQDAFARDLERRDLALRRSAAELSIEDLLHAASRTVLRTEAAHTLGLKS